jgi:hypothetical protein
MKYKCTPIQQDENPIEATTFPFIIQQLTHPPYTMVSQEWQALIDEKRAQREASIPSKWRIPKHVADKVSPTASVSAFELLDETDILSKEDREITELHDATALLELLAAGKVSSLAVTTAFCKRAAIAQQLVFDYLFQFLLLSSGMDEIVLIRFLAHIDKLSDGDLLRRGP